MGNILLGFTFLLLSCFIVLQSTFFTRKKFLLIGKILNAICSFFNAFLVYILLSMMVTKEPFLLFLKNTGANIIFNFLLIILISYYIYKQREDWFIEREMELDDEDEDDEEYDYIIVRKKD